MFNKKELIDLLKEFSFERRKVTLASGTESDFYIDCKQSMLTAKGHAIIGEMISFYLNNFTNVEAIAGVELGGCAIASAVSLTSYFNNCPIPALYIRKSKKDHGTSNLIEGSKSTYPGMRVVILEDVITTGNSVLYAATILRQHGLIPIGVIAIVDRLEGGYEKLINNNLPSISLTCKNDFFD